MEHETDAMKNATFCTLALACNFMFLQMGQGRARIASGERPPEDQNLNRDVEQNFGYSSVVETEETKKAKEDAMRWTRMHTNALENNPLGLIVGWGTAVAAPTSEVQRAFFIAFVACRWLHTICYLYKLQPWRALCWLFAWVSTFAMLVTALVELY